MYEDPLKMFDELLQEFGEGYPRARELVERVVRGDVRANRFRWVGEAAVYDVEGEWPVLYLTSRERSPILTRCAHEAAVALAEHKLLPLTDLDEVRAIKADPTTVRVVLSELELTEGGDCCWPLTPRSDRLLMSQVGLKQVDYDCWEATLSEGNPRKDVNPGLGTGLCARHPHFHIETEPGSVELNPAQRRLAEALFGTPLERYLNWLCAGGVFQTKVMALSQADVVARHEIHGPFAMGTRFSEVLGEWDADGNFLLSCDGILTEHVDDPAPGLAEIFEQFIKGTDGK